MEILTKLPCELQTLIKEYQNVRLRDGKWVRQVTYPPAVKELYANYIKYSGPLIKIVGSTSFKWKTLEMPKFFILYRRDLPYEYNFDETVLEMYKFFTDLDGTEINDYLMHTQHILEKRKISYSLKDGFINRWSDDIIIYPDVQLSKEIDKTWLTFICNLFGFA